MISDSRYSRRGVSASKEDVHNAIKNIDKGIFPKSFCKIIPDIIAGDTEYCNIMHADGAGTKSSLAYVYWKETGDLSVWKGIAQDAIIMNLDDLLCVGATDNILLSSTIGRNKNLIPSEVISAIITVAWNKYFFYWGRNCRRRRFGENDYRGFHRDVPNAKKRRYF
jgi:phosphoribosylformylglycinamidine cyclo-ligase